MCYLNVCVEECHQVGSTKEPFSLHPCVSRPFFDACVQYIRHVLGRCEGQVMRQASQEKSNAQIVEEMHKKVASTVV